MNGIAIRTEQLTRRFGALTAVDSVDLRVSAGQFFGFLGPNGAGDCWRQVPAAWNFWVWISNGTPST